MRPVVDMHCDLLWYLSMGPGRSILNPEVRCSLPQLRAGHVKLQTLAIFTQTESGSSLQGKEQINQFKQIAKQYPQDFQVIKRGDRLDIFQDSNPIKIMLAIENASGLFEENESLENGFKQIEEIENNVSKILYVSLTWNFENRFGGGALTTIGLKEDGRSLLDFLHRRGVSVDLSHASDRLASDILDYINKKGLKIPVLASHSNFRAISNVPRNLPDEIALEIWRQKGIIGFVFCRNFVGKEDPYNFVRQIEHIIKLGGIKQSCFGADFFYGEDLPLVYRKPAEEHFFPRYGDASTYGDVMKLWQSHLHLSEQVLDDISYQNFIDYFKQIPVFQ